jgi:hypothetical protein
VVLINALLGFIQEGRAKKALDSIRQHAVRGFQNGGETRDPGGGTTAEKGATA